VVNAQYDGKPLPPIVRDFPRGLLGPFGGDAEPRLPHFPLRLGDPDTAFKNQDRDDCSAYLREISSVADPELVKRLLAEGDTLGSQAVRPSGTVYQVRVEMGGNLEPGPFPGEPGITQSLQFWCEGKPWRVYEEHVQYEGKKRARYVIERSWLIASNHAEKWPCAKRMRALQHCWRRACLHAHRPIPGRRGFRDRFELVSAA